MQAALLETSPGALVIGEVVLDRPESREVLIRTVAAGCCHSDLHFMDGTFPYPTPTVLGHESAGVVEAVGADVTHVAPGDHVITCLSAFCGQCDWCVTGRPHLCTQTAIRRRPDQPPRLSRDGQPVFQFLELSSFAEQMLVHEDAVVKIREDMPLDRAALIGCGVTTGLGAVFNTAGVRPGADRGRDRLRRRGPVRHPGRRHRRRRAHHRHRHGELQAGSGPDDGRHRLDRRHRGDPVAAALDLSHGGVDHAFEAIGLASCAQQAFAMLARGGTATVIGMIPPGQVVEIPGFDLLSEKRIQGSRMGSNRFRLDMPRYVEMYLAGRLNLDDLVSNRLPLSEINSAFAAMKTGQIARDVIVFDA